ncbi:MAG TPA: DoxX family protein [Hyphomicrobiaceae bacterium]|nr:DoxX family protein [Hyphomicrobiaceae bacterium]
MQDTLGNAAGLLGRVMLAAIFVQSGWGKVWGYESTAKYMESRGVPGMLLPLVIVVELVGGLMVAAGWQTRLAAIALAGFTLLAGLLFHFQPADQGQMIHFMKNIAITGGFLVLAMAGAGGWSLDGRRGA